MDQKRAQWDKDSANPYQTANFMIDFAKYGMIANTAVFALDWFEVGPFKPKPQEIKQEVNNRKNKE